MRFAAIDQQSQLESDTRRMTDSTSPTPIEQLRNLGPTSASWLRACSISTIEELKRLGPVLAWRMVRARFPQASFNLLWALAAGIEDRDWRLLTDEEKKRLREEATTE